MLSQEIAGTNEIYVIIGQPLVHFDYGGGGVEDG